MAQVIGLPIAFRLKFAATGSIIRQVRDVNRVSLIKLEMLLRNPCLVIAMVLRG